jgi:hypothetical protein
VKQSNSSAGRRGLSTLFLSVGLLAATVGYLGLLARALVIDTSSTVDAATAALHNTEVQKLLTDRTADAVTSQLVGDSTVRDLAAFGIDVHRDLTPVAKTLLATPEFERAYADAVTQLHDHIFLDPTIAPTIDVTALVARARTEATAINPAYAQLIPPTATLVVTLPSDALPDLTAFDRQVTSSRTSLAIGLGVVMSAAALAGLQLLLSIAVHVAIGRVSGDAAPILRAGVGAVLPRLVIPALVPLVGGVVAIITSIRLHRAEGGRVLADGRDAFLNDEAGQPTEWTFDAVFEPEVLRTAPSAASFQR